MKSTWIIPQITDADTDRIVSRFGLKRHLAAILVSRGLINESEIEEYLNFRFSSLHSPFLMDGMHDAVARIKRGIDSGDRIAIFADSDLDGITSLAILHDVLTKFGVNPVVRYPHDREGYGLSCDVIREFISDGINLVLTVDSGIRDVAEVAYARESGVDVIITDHHEPGSELPDAIVINPKKTGCLYPFKDLAGVGVAFKLAQALLYSSTPAYNRKFLLVSRDNSIYTFTRVVNGCSGEVFSINKADIKLHLLTRLEPKEFLILMDGDDDYLSEFLSGIDLDITFTEFTAMAARILQSQDDNYKKDTGYESTISKIMKALGIMDNTCYSKLERSVRLFLELQWRSSRIIKQPDSTENVNYFGREQISCYLEEYAVLATIGTIADIMPLRGENRHLIRYGLACINQGKGHSGLLSLINKSEVTTKLIGWDISPLLNAPGRMGKTHLTVNFFLEKDTSKFDEIIAGIQKLNRERRKLVTEIIEKIREFRMRNNRIYDNNIFFYMDESILDGFAGLIASRIADELKKPVIIATGADETGYVKGSGRSSGNFNFFRHIIPCSHMFERVGGHSQAFGFTAKKEMMETIIDELNSSITNITDAEEPLKIDCIINSTDVNAAFINMLNIFEPFGRDNENPVFYIKALEIKGFTAFGSDAKHGKFFISSDVQAIGWDMADKMKYYYNEREPLDLVFTLENNRYLNRVYPRMILLDVDFS